MGGRGLDARPSAPHAALLVDRRGIFLGTLRLVRRAGPSDEIPRRGWVQPDSRGLGAGARGPGGRSWTDRAGPSLGPDRARVGMDGGQPGLRALLAGAARPSSRADGGAALLHGRLAGPARLWPHVRDRRDSGRNLRGPPLWRRLRHADAG